MYFKDFPSFYYDFKQNDGTTKSSIVKDITRNIRFRRDILANVTLYDRYDIRDGDTPEIIAEKVYGNAQYHWVIMLLNEKFDYIDTSSTIRCNVKWTPAIISSFECDILSCNINH